MSVSQPYHVNLHVALLDDWVGTEPNDLVNFVPVDWTVDIDLTHYEIFLFTNRYNWLDLADVENTRLAFCGSTGTISVGLPFTEFIPFQQKIHFSAKVCVCNVCELVCSFYFCTGSRFSSEALCSSLQC